MKSTGFGFCCIAAFLYASRFLCASIFMATRWSPTRENFVAGYDCIGPDLTIAAGISLAAGIVLLLVGALARRPTTRADEPPLRSGR